MGSSNYSEQRARHKQPATSEPRPGFVTIPGVLVRGESYKALLCDFGDNADHWVPKSQLAQRSQVRRRGDRGWLVVTDWFARHANIAKYAGQQSLEDRFPNFGRVLQALHARLETDDPERKDVNSLCDALRDDVGISQSPAAPQAGPQNGAGDGGGGGDVHTRRP